MRKCVSSSILRSLVGIKVSKVDTLLLFLHAHLDQANFVHILPSSIYFIRYRIPQKVRVLSSSKYPQKIIVQVCRIFINIVEWILDTPELWNSMNSITLEVSRGNSINGNFYLNPSSYIEANAQYCSCIVVTESTGWHKPYFASHDSLYILL